MIYNSFDYLASRYQLKPEQTSALRQTYEENVAAVMRGLPEDVVTSFSSNEMQPDGIVTLQSPFGFEETLKRINAAIDAQDDTVRFGTVDFQAVGGDTYLSFNDPGKLGVDLPPSHMILFGAPGPGGKAMADAPTLGLDGFCQKFLVWQDVGGDTYLSFNDLLDLAERQEASSSIALRVINFRLSKTFGDALETD